MNHSRQQMRVSAPNGTQFVLSLNLGFFFVVDDMKVKEP